MRAAGILLALIIAVAPDAGRALARTREQPQSTAQIAIEAAGDGCAVALDATPEGTTTAQGTLLLSGVDATDHYVHVSCPGQPERGYFVSLRPGDRLDLQAAPAAAAPALSGLEAAEAKIALRKLVLKAVQERAAGDFDDAVRDLHQAARMDPGNSDLHRELGITFLLVRDWKRARVEMLEAIRHDPNNADAHNGLGYALEKMGDMRTALQEYRTATHLDPDDASYEKHYLEALAEVSAAPAGKKKQR